MRIAGIAALGLALACPATADASLSFSPTAIDFGRPVVGTSSVSIATTLTLRCDTAPCTMTDGDSHDPRIGVSNPAFKFSDDCPPRLIVNTSVPTASCTVYVRFKPSAPGPYSATLTSGAKGLEGEPKVTLAGVAVVPQPAAPAKRKCKRKRKARCKKKRPRR